MFRVVLADWGSAKIGGGGQFFSGTPLYAGPHTYFSGNKDLFSFGRLAMELIFGRSGFCSFNILDFVLRNT